MEMAADYLSTAALAAGCKPTALAAGCKPTALAAGCEPTALAAGLEVFVINLPTNVPMPDSNPAFPIPN